MIYLNQLSNFLSVYWPYLVTAYLLGSIPFGLILGLLIKKVDVRKQGSGNLGATNVTRVLGKKLGALTLFLDALKGSIPVLIAGFIIHKSAFINQYHSWITLEFLQISLGFAAFLGHCYPVYLKFKGGKGIATGTGVALIFEPFGFIFAFVIFVITFKLFKKVSLSALICAFLLFLYILFKWQIQIPILITISAMLVVIVVRHKDNIKRLINGTESGV